ncbi:MAG: glycosyltransferase family 2 protein [Desulfobaccales bacterium]
MGLRGFQTLIADWRRRLPYRRYLDLEDRPRRLAAQSLSMLTLVLGALYLAWLGRLMWRAPGDQSILFFIAETLAYLLLVFLTLDLGRRRYHRPEGLEIAERPSVDTFVTYCGEPLEVIRTTLLAVSRIRYQPLEVYVLDDQGSPEVADLAQSLNFHYHSRPREGLPRQDAKSGNLNFGLGLSRGELILVLDADQVPAPDILSRLVGFFRLPKVAYVQSKQSFYLPEHDPFFNRDEIFYEVVQPCNDEANAVISCGSGVVYRRAALEEIGGYVTWNILEDMTTSYKLLSRGWKGLYFPYALSRGLAPLNLAGVYRQRFQWCLDTMRLFFWDNPLRKPGLNWSQRFHFLLIMVNYLISGLVFPVFYFLPLLGYWEGYSCFQNQEGHYLVLRGLYLAATVFMFRYLFFQKDAVKQFKILCGLSPVYAAAIFAALIYPPGRKPAYRINNRQPFSESIGYLLLLPQLGIIFLHLTLPFLSLHLGWAPPHLIVLNCFFSAFIIWVLADLTLAGLKKPQWHSTMDPRQVYGS